MRKIKFYRLNSEKTQREIAKEIGCTQALISMFETGKVIPGKKFKEAIAEALNRPEDEIFPRKDNNE